MPHSNGSVSKLDLVNTDTFQVALPSVHSVNKSSATLDDDTAAVRNATVDELKHKNVVLVAHSYGGVPTNNALDGLDTASRLRDGASTAVKGLIFISSFPLPKGFTVGDGLAGVTPIARIEGDLLDVSIGSPARISPISYPLGQGSRPGTLLL